MKCKKYDQTWFNNKYIQILKMNCSPEKKIQKLISFMNLAKKHNIKPRATKELKVKYTREDYGIPKSEHSIRVRKSRLKRKHRRLS